MKKAILILGLYLLGNINESIAMDNYYTNQYVEQLGGQHIHANTLNFSQLLKLGNMAMLDGSRRDAIEDGKLDLRGENLDLKAVNIIESDILGHYSEQVADFDINNLTVQDLIKFGHLFYLDKEYQEMEEEGKLNHYEAALDSKADNADILGQVTEAKWSDRLNEPLTNLTISDIVSLFQDCWYDGECDALMEEGKVDSVAVLLAERDVDAE